MPADLMGHLSLFAIIKGCINKITILYFLLATTQPQQSEALPAHSYL